MSRSEFPENLAFRVTAEFYDELWDFFKKESVNTRFCSFSDFLRCCIELGFQNVSMSSAFDDLKS